MGKNYVESSLKRFLKRKVKITLGLVVAFMITGGVSFGIKGPFVAHDNDGTNYQVKKLEDENITITGGLIGLEYGTVSKYGQAGATGSILALNGGTVNIGNEKTKKINLISTGIYAQTLSSDNSYGSSETGKGGIINVITDELNIEAHGKKGKSNYAIGIYALNRSMKASSENVSKIIINSKKTTINCTIEEGRSSGIQAWSQGQVFINEGTLEVKADDIIKTRGKSLVQLNAKNNSQNTMKLDGDINFAYNATQSGTTVDSDIIINLSNKDSYFNGKIYSSGNPTAGKSIVNGMKLGLYNGGTWNVTGDSFANEIVIKDGGKISFGNGEDKTLEMWNREEATDKLAAYDKGIQMQGGAIVEGNGNIVAYDLDLKQISANPLKEELTKTVYGNAITVTGEGNILALGKSSSITGNVLIETGAELTNKGMFKVVGTADKEVVLTNKGTINLASGTSVTLGEKSSFKNEKGATLNVESGATAITGGTTTNNGVISLKDTDNSDKTVSKLLAGGILTNEGTIALADRAEAMTDENWNKLLETLITDKGTFTNKGMVVDKAGNSIFSAGTTIESGTAGELLESGVAGSGETIKIEDKQDGTATTITGSKTGEETDTLKDITVNVEGNLNLAVGSGAGVVMEDVTMNVSSGNSVTATGEGHKLSGNVVLNGESSIVVGDGQGTSDSNLTLSGAVSQGAVEENKATKIEVKQDGTLNLVDATVNVAINSDATGQTGAVTSKGETSIKDITAASLDIMKGTEEVNITTVDGEIAVTNIIVGKETGTRLFSLRRDVTLDETVKSVLELSSTSKFTNAGTLTINKDGAVVLGIGSKVTNGQYSENAFGNSNSTVTVNGAGKIVLDTTNISGKEAVIGLGNHTFTNNNFVSGSEIYKVDEKDADLKDGLTIKYNDTLFEGNNELSAIHNAASVLAGGTFAGTKAEREVQLDKIYSSNIYSETVKAAYDTVKMNEEAVLSLARKSEVGKWTAEGKALYSKDEYDRNGTVGDYSSEIESTGLMAAFGYGLNETTTAGVAFSGVKQDVDTDGGSADADLFYLGVYGNKVYGNYDFTAGLGYQFGEYEADNTITNVHSSDKYDSKALSGYVQGRYTADLGDGLSLQPRVRLGYTYVEQDDTRDSYFGVSDTEISTFDAEFGLDTVKSVQLEKSKVDVKFGVSYVRTMGDTDDEFTGRFYGTTASEGFDVLGAELAENVVKFNLGAEVTNENGFFYNGGLTYEFGSNDTDAYGINVGVGYKF